MNKIADINATRTARAPACRTRAWVRAALVATTLVVTAPCALAQAILPTAFSGSSWQTELPVGWAQSGMGPDYSGSYDSGDGKAGKFDDPGDILTINISYEPGTLSYWLKGEPAGSATVTTGTFAIAQSPDGANYMAVRTLTNMNSVATSYTNTLDATTRYIRFRYESKTSGNVGIDGVSISAPAQFVNITNPATETVTVPGATNSYTLAGTSSNIVGQMAWSNALTQTSGTFAAAPAWSVAGVALGVGSNIVIVTGTNAAGTAASDSVTITRLLKVGDVAIIGWFDNGNPDSFAIVTLAQIPAGTVLYFTDNGWTNDHFRDGEKLLKFTAKAAILAGQIICSTNTSTSNNFTWQNTDGFTNLLLATEGDQIYIFQGPNENPLSNPLAHIFVLDDTGAFEAATESNSGGVPTGLVTGLTAVTFAQYGGSQNFMAFTNYSGAEKTKTEWLAAIANSNNWYFGANGTLPTGRLDVAAAPMLSVLVEPEGSGSVQGGGSYDAGEVAHLTATPNIGWVFSRWEDRSVKSPLGDFTMPSSDTTVTAYFAWTGTALFLW